MGITVIQPRELIQKAIEAYQSELALSQPISSANANGQEENGEGTSTSQPPTPTKPEPPQVRLTDTMHMCMYVCMYACTYMHDTQVRMYAHECTVKTAIYDLCGQRPPGLYDQNSMHA